MGTLSKGDAKPLMSSETREELLFLISGFTQLVSEVTQKLLVPIISAYINSDIIENLFCQQRGIHHGASTSPNYQQYAYGVNSIILGQNTISSKANANQRKATTTKGAVPYKQLCGKQPRL